MTNAEKRQSGARNIVAAREYLMAAAADLDGVPTCEKALHIVRMETLACDDALSELAFREGHSTLSTFDRLDDSGSDYEADAWAAHNRVEL